MEAPKLVVPAAPVFVRPTPTHTLASAAIVRPEMDFPRKRYCRSATHGVVIIFANLRSVSAGKEKKREPRGNYTDKIQLSCMPNSNCPESKTQQKMNTKESFAEKAGEWARTG